MEHRSRFEAYQAFIEFIAHHIQVERHQVNRKMFSVFLWCFLLPIAMTLTVLVLVKFRVFPHTARNHLDWLVLILPVLYSLYILSSEVLVRVPSAFRKGGIATTLGQSLKEGKWRDHVAQEMDKAVGTSHEEWAWIVANFKMDLLTIQYRIRYLTALAGAVFFLLMHGVDSLTAGEGRMTWVKTPLLGWIETSSGGDLSQYVGLGLFLILLYLSGHQTHQILNRYLNCAELVLGKLDRKK